MKLHEFVEWFRNDIAYVAPELWPGRITWFLDEVKERYASVEQLEEEECWPDD